MAKRPHLGAIVQSIPDPHRLESRNQFGEEAAVNARLHEEARERNAALNGIAQLVGRKRAGRGLCIGIVEHNHGGMSAQFHRCALHVPTGQFRQLLAHLDRAGDDDLANRGMGKRRELVDALERVLFP